MPFVTQNGHDLPGGSDPPPQLKHASQCVADLLIGGQHDVTVLVAVKPDRKVLLKLAALRLVAQAAVQAGAQSWCP